MSTTLLNLCMFHTVLGNALTCQKCMYNSTLPQVQQKCNQSVTMNCNSSTSYCYTTKYTDENSTVHVGRDCDEQKTFCLDAEKTCSAMTKSHNLKTCAAACCKTDNCNNYYPTSTATGMVAKFTLIMMVIAGLVA